MAFGKRESYNVNYVAYTESIDMILHDLQSMGYKSLTKEKLNEIFCNDFSVGRAVRIEICKILNSIK